MSAFMSSDDPKINAETLKKLALCDYKHDATTSAKGEPSGYSRAPEGWVQKTFRMCAGTIPFLPSRTPSSVPYLKNENEGVNALLGAPFIQDMQQLISQGEYNDDGQINGINDDTNIFPNIHNTGGPQYKVRALGHKNNTGDDNWRDLNIMTGKHLFLIVDYKYKELYNIIKNTEANKCSWVETVETLFDPADKNVRTMEQKSLSDDGTVKARGRSEKQRETFYPLWNQGNTDKEIDNLPVPNMMFFSNYNINQLVDTTKKTTAYINFKAANGKYWSLKGGRGVAGKFLRMAGLPGKQWRKTLGKALLKPFKKFTKKLFKKMKRGRKPKSAQFIPQYMVMGKRLGDQGQALACLRTISPTDVRPTLADPTIPIVNVFVTHDRLAFTAAILYRVPAVIFMWSNATDRGSFIVYQKKLDSISEQIADMKKKIHIMDEKLVDLEEREVVADTNYETFKQEIHMKIKATIKKYFTLSSNPSNLNAANELYKNSLRDFFILRQEIDTFTELQKAYDGVAGKWGRDRAKSDPASEGLADLTQVYSLKQNYVTKFNKYINCAFNIPTWAPSINIRNIENIKLSGPKVRWKFRAPRLSLLKDKREVYTCTNELSSILESMQNLKDYAGDSDDDFLSQISTFEQSIYNLFQNILQQILKLATTSSTKWWSKILIEYIEAEIKNRGLPLIVVPRTQTGGVRGQYISNIPKLNILDYDTQIRTYIALCIASIDGPINFTISGVPQIIKYENFNPHLVTPCIDWINDEGVDTQENRTLMLSIEDDDEETDNGLDEFNNSAGVLYDYIADQFDDYWGNANFEKIEEEVDNALRMLDGAYKQREPVAWSYFYLGENERVGEGVKRKGASSDAMGGDDSGHSAAAAPRRRTFQSRLAAQEVEPDEAARAWGAPGATVTRQKAHLNTHATNKNSGGRKRTKRHRRKRKRTKRRHRRKKRTRRRKSKKKRTKRRRKRR